MDVVSLFAGAGGLDLGLIQAGHQVVWANDIDPDCVQTYAHNIGSHIIHSDIKHIAAEDIPDSEVVVGGFPCQGFSLANRLRSKDDERNQLYIHFKRIVKEKQPKYFLAENVRGILSLDKGNAIKTIIQDFTNVGYSVKYHAFNTADYGVPQTRVRVIIAGTRIDLPEEMEYQYPEPTHHKDGKDGLKKWITIGEALHGIPEPEFANGTYLNHVCSKYKVTNRNYTGHRRTDPSKPSPTILARGNGKGGVCAIQHPNNHRRMSVRESAIVQSFPKDFKFFGSLMSMYRQVGNAVPVAFGKKLGDQLSLIKEVFV